MLGDDIEIDSGGLDTGVAQKFLDCTKVGAPFYQGCSEEMAQPMGGEVIDAGSEGVFLDDAVQLLILYGKKLVGGAQTIVTDIGLQGFDQATR